MPVRPSQAVADLGAELASRRIRARLVHPDACVDGRVNEVADRVHGDRYRGSQQTDKSAADRWPESLRGGVGLVEPRVGRDQLRLGHQARKQ
jgi:hypothetical protein